MSELRPAGSATALRKLASTAAGMGAALVGFIQAGAGAVARLVLDKLRETVTPADFAAVGNGVADDTAAIVAAVATGKHVDFGGQDKTYLITSTITPTTDRQWLTGRGATITTTAAVDHLDLAGSSGDYIQHVRIAGLRFTGANGRGIRTRFTEGLQVEGCIFSGTVNGLNMAENANEEDVKPSITGNKFYNCSYGIKSGDTRLADANVAFNFFVNCSVRALSISYLDGGSVCHNKVFNDLSSATENDGFLIGRPIYAKIENNDIFEVNGYGLYISSPRRSHIKGNTVIKTGKTSRKQALYCPQYSGAVVSELNEICENKIYQAYGSAMDLRNMDDSDVLGNKIVEAGYTAGSLIYDGIALNTCTKLRVRRSLVDGNAVTRYWLSVTSSTDIEVGGDNRVRDCVNADLFRSGTVTMTIGENPAPVSIAATYTATFLESIIYADATAGAITVNLPNAVSCKGKAFEIIKTDGSVNAVTADPTSTQTINGASTKALTLQYAKTKIRSDGANWLEM